VIDHERVGRECQPSPTCNACRNLKSRLILHLADGRADEGCHEHVVDQVAHRLSAAAMRQRYHGRAQETRAAKG
jgi:hypothetical protein